MIPEHTQKSRLFSAVLTGIVVVLLIVAIKAKHDDVLYTGRSHKTQESIKIGADRSCIGSVCYPADGLPERYACLNDHASARWQDNGITILIVYLVFCAVTTYTPKTWAWITTLVVTFFTGATALIVNITSQHTLCLFEEPIENVTLGCTTQAWGNVCLACIGMFVGWIVLAIMLRHRPPNALGQGLVPITGAVYGTTDIYYTPIQGEAVCGTVVTI